MTSIASKLHFAVAAIMAVFLAVCGFTMARALSYSRDTSEAYRADVAASLALSRAQQAIWAQRDLLTRFAAAGGDAHAHIVAEDRVLTSDVNASLDHLGTYVTGEMEQRELATLRERYGKYVAARPKWFELIAAGAKDEAQDWRNAEVSPIGTDVAKVISHLADLMQTSSTQHVEAQRVATSRTIAWLGGISLAGFLVLACMAAWMRNAVVKPLRTSVAMLETIAEGEADLTRRAPENRSDEFGSIAKAFNKTIGRFERVIVRVREAGGEVRSAARDISQATADFASRIEEQASSLEETAASMEEFSGTVAQNAEGAQRAKTLALEASSQAQMAGAGTADVVRTMGEIAGSAARIGEIVAVIDGIAFQTNILALNAAVEAARAGAEGRGFAVVAAEVRALAHRSAQAAREIKELIHESGERVAEGRTLVERTGQSMSGLVERVREVGTLMTAIAQATAEQSRGAQQVAGTVTQMDRLVQQNAAAVQEASAAAKSMAELSDGLMATVQDFKAAPHDEAPARSPSKGALVPVALAFES